MNKRLVRLTVLVSSIAAFSVLPSLAQGEWKNDLNQCMQAIRASDIAKAGPILKTCMTKASTEKSLSKRDLHDLEVGTADLTKLRFETFKKKYGALPPQQARLKFKEVTSIILIENKQLLGLYEKFCGKNDEGSVGIRQAIQRLETASKG